MKIIDNRIGDLVQYKDLNLGDVFSINKSGEDKICMKTSLAIESFDEDSQLYGLTKVSKGRYRQEFAVSLETGIHFDVEPNKVVRKVKAELIVKD